MSDAGSLLIILCAIYLSECCQWLRVDTVLVCNPWLLSWRVKYPRGVFGNDQNRLICGSIFPPLGPAFVTQWWPVSVSPEAIFAYTPQAVNPQTSPSHSKRLIKIADIREISVRESELIINDESLVKFCSPQLAWSFAKLVRKLESSAESERGKVVDRALDRALESRAVQLRYQVTTKRTKFLWLLSNLLFVYLVAVSMLLLYSSTARLLWPFWLAILFVLVAQTIWEFRSVSRKLYRRHPMQWKAHGLMMALSPLGAIRAFDFASRYALSTFHPLAVAQSLCRPKVSRLIAQHALLDLKYPLSKLDAKLSVQQAATVSWFQEHLEAAVQRSFVRAGIYADELLTPPDAEGADCVSYCPRCHAQYVLAEGVCEPCQNILLRPFSSNLD